MQIKLMYNVVDHSIILYNKKLETIFTSHNKIMAKNHASFR